MSTLSVPYSYRRLRRRLRRAVRRPGFLIRLARYAVGFGLAAVVLGVGSLQWLPLLSVVLGAAFVLYVVAFADFTGVRDFLRWARRRDHFAEAVDDIARGTR